MNVKKLLRVRKVAEMMEWSLVIFLAGLVAGVIGMGIVKLIGIDPINLWIDDLLLRWELWV